MRLIPRCIPGLLTALAVAGCNIEAGNGPVSLSFIEPTGETQESTVLFLCSEARPRLGLRFSNGSLIDLLADGFLGYDTRFSSSDESVFKVSNGTGDLPIPGNPDLFYRKGVLLPIAAGTATLTAHYSDFTTEMEVEVRGPDSIMVEPQQQAIALGTRFGFRATAVQDGREVDITSSVLWRLRDAAGEEVEDDIGTINATAPGAVAAVAEAEGMTVEATLSACAGFEQLPPTVDPEDLTADVSFQVPQSVELTREFEEIDPDTGDPLINGVRLRGTSEQFSLTARFADPEDGTQDLTAFMVPGAVAAFQIVEPGLDDDEVTTKAGTILGIAGLVSMVEVTDPGVPLEISATYGSDEPPEEGEPTPPPLRTSNTLTLEIVEGELQALDISPQDAIVDFGEFQQFTGTGSFLLEDESTLMQDITRHVRWTSSDTAVAAISSQVSNAGLSQVVTEEPACTFITAVPVVDDEIEVRTRLFANDNTAACVEPEDDDTAG